MLILRVKIPGLELRHGILRALGALSKKPDDARMRWAGVGFITGTPFIICGTDSRYMAISEVPIQTRTSPFPRRTASITEESARKFLVNEDLDGMPNVSLEMRCHKNPEHNTVVINGQRLACTGWPYPDIRIVLGKITAKNEIMTNRRRLIEIIQDLDSKKGKSIFIIRSKGQMLRCSIELPSPDPKILNKSVELEFKGKTKSDLRCYPHQILKALKSIATETARISWSGDRGQPYMVEPEPRGGFIGISSPLLP